MEALSRGCRLIISALPGVKGLFADAGNSMFRLLKLPPLDTIDTPFRADIPDLEIRLPLVLENTIHEVLTVPKQDWQDARTKSFPYTWETLFYNSIGYEKTLGPKYEQV
jgi:hypothetical protein